MQDLVALKVISFTIPFLNLTLSVNPVTIITTWVIIIVIFILARLSVRRLSMVPARPQAAAEFLYANFAETLEESMGESGRKFIPFIATLFVFVLMCNWASLIPNVKSPTSDMNTCFALGILVLFVSHGYAIRKKGLKEYLKAYFEPTPFLFFSNVISEISKVLSHSLRLFGNLFAGGLLIALVPTLLVQLFKLWGIPVGILAMPGLNAFFGLFLGGVQALVFTLLAAAYINVISE
jgi:F-type H+-transporting ATPase subunit a